MDSKCLGSICRDIAQDIDTKKRSILWNEVEFKQVPYEMLHSRLPDELMTMPNDVDDQNKQIELTEPTAPDPIEPQANEDVFDSLVKSKFAST